MNTLLTDAPLNTDLTLTGVKNPALHRWLQRLGLFVGGHLLRHDQEINYYPVRVRGSRGDVIVPAGLGIKIVVHLNSGERKPLVEMNRNEKGHIETIACGKGCAHAMECLGIEEDMEITFIKALPHMDYLALINRQERTRLSEGEAARIWGKNENEESTQFYFAKRNIPFLVEAILGGDKIQEHLLTHGIRVGCHLLLESIEQTRELHKPGLEPVTISSPGGLRLYLNPAQAGQILVKCAVRRPDMPSGQQDAATGRKG